MHQPSSDDAVADVDAEELGRALLERVELVLERLVVGRARAPSRGSGRRISVVVGTVSKAEYRWIAHCASGEIW